MGDRTTIGLDGIRVLELGEMVSAPYAGKLLADLGADVIKIEPPDGDPARRRGPFRADPDPDASGLFLALNTNKRSMVVGPDDPGRLEPVLADADIVLTNLTTTQLARFGVELASLHRDRPDLVICAITPFGLSGPYADYVAEELTVAHAGGWAYLCPGASEEPDQPPLKVFGHQCDFHAGMAGALVALAAFDRAERTRAGDLIDFSAMAHIAGLLETAFIAASYMGENPNRFGSRILNPWGIYPCQDGLMFMVCVEQDQWERLVDFMGTPEWTQMGLFDTLEQRLENDDLLTHYLSQWTAQWPVDDLWHEGQARRICFAPVFTMDDMAEQPQLRERGFLSDVEHPVAGTVTHLGAPFVSSNAMWGPLRPAPVLDAGATPGFGPRRSGWSSTSEAEPGRPLDGVRVLDLTWVWAGPYGTMHLAHLGADVVKIESSLRPDLGRRLSVHPTDGTEPTLNTSAYFNQWGQGKKSYELDLSQPESIDIVKRLVAQSDVVVENFATGVMDRLGLSYDQLRAVKPDVIVASISGYGGTGPLRDYMGYGPTTGPLSGLSSLTGYQGGPPRELGVSIGDPGAGITAAFAVCAALSSRRVTGEGCYIDVALWESTASNAVEGWMHHAITGSEPARMGNRDPLMAPHNCYRTSGDDWISIACPDDASWARLAGLIDPSLVEDHRFATARDRKTNEDDLDRVIGDWTEGRERWDLTEELQALSIPAFPSMSPMDLLHDRHLEARGFIERLDHPEVGRRAHTGLPWISATGPNGVMRRAPLLGEHDRELSARLR